MVSSQFLIFIALLSVSVLPQLSSSMYVSPYPVCTDTSFNSAGLLDISTMLYNCSKNIPGSLEPPSYYPVRPDVSTYAPTNVSVQLSLYNLLSINDVESTVSMELYFRLYWIDPRINIPDIFKYSNPQCETEGIYLQNYIRDPAAPLSFWLPDVVFFSTIESTVIAESIKMFPDNLMFWSRHMTLTIPQPTMNFKNYPLDTQNFSILIESYAFGSEMVSLSFVDNNAVTLIKNPQYSEPFIALNQLWSYETFSSYINERPSPSATNPTRRMSCAVINLAFTRRKYGIILRLALPVTIFLLIVGFSFWGDSDKRVDIALNMTLVVAALYLVIGQVIPLVGYFTIMDTFVTMSFSLLSGIVAVHFFVQILDNSAEKYPLNKLLAAMIVLVFRFLWIPSALAVLVVYFDVNLVPILAVLYLSTILSVLNAFYSLKTKFPVSFEKAIIRLREKYEAKKPQDPTLIQRMEMKVLERTQGMYRTIPNNEDATMSLEGQYEADTMAFSHPTSALSDIEMKPMTNNYIVNGV